LDKTPFRKGQGDRGRPGRSRAAWRTAWTTISSWVAS